MVSIAQGRLGGVHKLNVLSGVSIIAENIEPMGVGLRGVSRLRIAKERPGLLRAHGSPSAGLRWIGDFVLGTGQLEEPALILPTHRGHAEGLRRDGEGRQAVDPERHARSGPYQGCHYPPSTSDPGRREIHRPTKRAT
jgi:hypothetical protein